MKSRSSRTSIPANDQGPRNAASHRIDHIALLTECNHQTTRVASNNLKHIATQTNKNVVIRTYMHGKAQALLG